MQRETLEAQARQTIREAVDELAVIALNLATSYSDYTQGKIRKRVEELKQQIEDTLKVLALTSAVRQRVEFEREINKAG